MRDLKQVLEGLADKFEQPSDDFPDYLRRHKLRRRRQQRVAVLTTLSILVVAVASMGALEALHRSTPKASRSANAAATFSTTATQPLCPVLGPPGDVPSLSSSSGPAGSTVTISGPLPDSNGRVYLGPGSPDLTVYWNLNPDDWESVYQSPNSPTASVAGTPVQYLGTQHFTGACNFQMQIQIPSGAAPGTYPIVVLIQDSGWGTDLDPMNYQVVGS
jgi:hypothetical protein